MTDDKPKDLKKEDVELWEAMTSDVERLPGREYEPGTEPEKNEKPVSSGGETVLIPKKNQGGKTVRGKEIDRRTEERLRRGQMPIEGRLDLHGMRQDEAQKALNNFILEAYAQGKRCVLVITGKGKTKTPPGEWFEPRPGVLKKRVPEWLNSNPLGPVVLKTSPAKVHDGGDGALYVLLRRRRD